MARRNPAPSLGACRRRTAHGEGGSYRNAQMRPGNGPTRASRSAPRSLPDGSAAATKTELLGRGHCQVKRQPEAQPRPRRGLCLGRGWRGAPFQKVPQPCHVCAETSDSDPEAAPGGWCRVLTGM